MHASHPISRAFEHYGVRLTLLELRALEQQCCDGARLVSRSKYGEVRAVKHGDVEMLAVWLPWIIVTFLARGAYGGALAPRPTLGDICPQLATLKPKETNHAA